MSSQLQESQLVNASFGFESNSHPPNLGGECDISMAYDEESSEVNNGVPLDKDVCGGGFSGTSALIDHDTVQQESLRSIANDTQFVDVEYDTQATDSYDLSPTTQMAFQNVDQNPDEHSSAINPRNYIERQKPTVTDDVSNKFQFGPVPDPNALKLRRPPPGKAFSFSECTNPQNLPPSSDSVATGIKQGYSGESGGGISLPSRGLTRARKRSSSRETKDTAEPPIPDGLTTEGRCLHSDSALQVGNQKAGIIQTQKQDKSTKRHIYSKLPFQILEASMANNKPAPEASAEPRIQKDHESVSCSLRTHAGASADAVSSPGAELMIRNPTESTVVSRDSIDRELHSSFLPIAVAVDKPIGSKQTTLVLHLDSNAIHRNEGHYGRTDGTSSAPLTNSEDCSLENSCAPYIPPQMRTEGVSGPITRHMALTGGPQNGRPLEILDSKHVYGKEISGYQSQRSTSNALANRPPPPKQLQSEELEASRSSRHRDSHAIETGPSNPTLTSRARVSSSHQSGAFRTPSASEMVDILKVTVDSEEEKRRASNAIIEKQESQIIDLSARNVALQQQINDLEQKNEEMVGKLSGFKDRCAAYKAHMNQVTEGHKALWERSEELKRARGDLLAMLQDRDRQNLEAQKKIEEVRSLFSVRVKRTWAEASQKLINQDQTILLLKHDLDNRLLDLQRERGRTERLQRELDDKTNLRDYLGKLLRGHQETINTLVIGCNSGISEILSTKHYNRERIDECMNLINSLKDSEPQTSPALEELIRIVKYLSEITENRLQENDKDVQLRHANSEVIAELRTCIEKIDLQQGAQAQLNEGIVQLRTDNAELSDQIRGRDGKISELNSQIGNIRFELETCRGNLSATVDELNRFRVMSAEEPGLLAQLRDLQEVCSGLRAEVESANREAERAKLSLHNSEESSALLQDSIGTLKDAIEQAEAKISGFNNEREDYIKACKKESENQRLQTEKDFNQRLEEQKEDHASLVSGLRRQKADAEERKSISEGKVDSLQAELNKSGQMNSDLERVASELQTKISALQVRTCGQEVETSRFEGVLESFREHNNSAAAELQIVRNLIHQCIDDTNKIAEETATKFEKLKEVTGIQLHKVEEDSQMEVRRLKEELASLQKQAERHLALQDSVGCYLRANGILGQADSVDMLFATTTAQPSVQDLRSDESDRNSRPSVHFCPTNTYPAPLTDKEPPAKDVVPPEIFDVNTISPAYLFPDDAVYNSIEFGALVSETGNRSLVPEYNSSHFKFGTSTMSKNLRSPKSNLDESCVRRPSILCSKPTALVCDSQQLPLVDFPTRYAPLQLEAPKGLMRAETVEIPDSQQENSLLPCLISSKRKPNVARRRDTLTISPQAQKGDRLVEHTQITDINIQKTSTYESDPNEGNSRRSSARETILGLAALFTDGLPGEIDQLMQTDDGYQIHRDRGPSHFHSSTKENHPQPSKVPDRPIKSCAKLPKSILKRNNLVAPPSGQLSRELAQTPVMRDKLRTSGTDRSLSRIPSERLRGSRYNRVASGNPVTKLAETNKNRTTPNSPRQVIMTFSPDIFAITNSPEVQDPRRNALKRSGSILGSHPGHKTAKLQRH